MDSIVAEVPEDDGDGVGVTMVTVLGFKGLSGLRVSLQIFLLLFLSTI